MVRHQVHHAIDTFIRGHGGHAVSHDFLHRHRPDCLAVASKCVNDFTFGDETKNFIPTRHHESADILCAQPVRRTLDASFRTYCCNVGALPPQDVFDGHCLLPSCGLAASLIESAWLCQSTSPPQLEACGHLAHEIHLVAFGSALRRLGSISVPHWAHTP